MNVAVIGLGAMGGGMARALLESSVCKTVVGYDVNVQSTEAFFLEASAIGKAGLAAAPSSLKEIITEDTQYVILVLQNESQCEQVCFGGIAPLQSTIKAGSCVILCSTVTATWAKHASKSFGESEIHFIDCPISGGPVRARAGELTLMVSGDGKDIENAKTVLSAMGNQVHFIEGGVGMGSTVKMVHQLLAGVHIVAAAEALALAAKAGLDVEQIYEIVNGAAGASWMFKDRGQRMLHENSIEEVKSQLQIFVKDLDIVYSEAKRLRAPIPLASAALQQYISAESLGLSKMDDSQVIQVYETLTGVKVGSTGVGSKVKYGDNVGDLWEITDGEVEEILEVGQEPRHQIVISNEYIRALRVSFPPGDSTLAHRHEEDSLYFFLVEGGLNVVNHVKGSSPQCDCMNFGEIRYGTHKSEKPLVHKLTNKSKSHVLCIDAEVLKQPPVTSPIPLVADKHELVKTRQKCRVYQLKLAPGESVSVAYPFFHFIVVLKGGTVEKELLSGRIRWTENTKTGDVAWKEPVASISKRNVGATEYVEFIAEWL